MTNNVNPSAIIFVNYDGLSDSVKNYLINQLQIDEVMNSDQFNQKILNDNNYNVTIHLQKKRILVIKDFSDLSNRDKCDIVIFIKNGLAAIEKNNFGPHGFTFPVATLSISNLFKHKS